MAISNFLLIKKNEIRSETFNQTSLNYKGKIKVIFRFFEIKKKVKS